MSAKARETVKDFLIITIATAIVSCAVFFFLMPSHISVGSISGLAIVVSNLVPLPVSALTMIFNVSLLVVGFLLIGREFGGKTVYTSLLLPVFLGILERAFPNFESIMGDAFLDMICYVFTVSIGLAMLFTRNASSGGLDIVAKLMNKFLGMDMGKAMGLAGILVALSSALVYDKKIVVISVLGTYFGGMIVDHFIFGMNIKRRVCIISQHLDVIKDYILYDLHSGASLNEIIGAYDNRPRREIITIVDKQEFKLLMDFVRKTDPKAFITVYSVSEICYQPKK